MPFDPYYTWLGIPPQDQPPNHYRLLGVQLFEPSGEVIDNAADRQMAHVRSFQTGPNAADSQRLLTQISSARVTLLDPRRRAEYDTQLLEALRPAAVSQPAPVYYSPAPYGPAVAPQPYYPPPEAPYGVPQYPGAAAPAPLPAVMPGPLPTPIPRPQPVAVAPHGYQYPVPQSPVSAEAEIPVAQPDDSETASVASAAPLEVKPQPVVEVTTKPVEKPATSPALFSPDPGRSSLAGKRRHRKNATVETIKVVMGGIVGLAIGAAVLWYGFDVNPLGTEQPSSHGDTRKPADGQGDRSKSGSTHVASRNPPTGMRDPREPSAGKTATGSFDNGGTAEPGAGTPDATKGPPKLALEYRRVEKDQPAGQVGADLRLANQGGMPVKLEKITLRYWYKHAGHPRRFWCDAASVGAGRVTYRFITLDEPVLAANGFCEIGFLPAAGELAPGASRVELKVRLTSADDSPLDASQDYSQLAMSDEYAKTDRITVYQEGKLLAGSEPSGLAGREFALAGSGPAQVAQPFTPEGGTTGRGPRVARPRVAVPASELVEEALAEIDRVFRTNDKRSRTERVELAGKLRKSGLETDERPAEQYALLKRAAEVAQNAGEAKLVVDILEQLEERFELDGPLVRQKLLLKTMGMISDEPRLQQALLAARDTIYDLILTDRYEEALALANRGVDLCAEPIGKSQRKFVTDGRNSLRALNLQWQEAQKARKILEEDPADPAANSTLGRWLCLQIDDWQSGLNHLARGADPKLAQVAAADLATGQLLEAQQAIADQWYDLCLGSATNTGYAARALYWYEKTRGQLSGLAKAKVEERVEQLRDDLAGYDKTTFNRRALRTFRPKSPSS